MVHVKRRIWIGVVHEGNAIVGSHYEGGVILSEVLHLYFHFIVFFHISKPCDRIAKVLDRTPV